jgi:hypothetical protein
MKRVHRRWHKLAWLVLAPVTAGVLGLALASRSAEHVNANLPAFLVWAPASQSI